MYSVYTSMLRAEGWRWMILSSFGKSSYCRKRNRQGNTQQPSREIPAPKTVHWAPGRGTMTAQSSLGSLLLPGGWGKGWWEDGQGTC